MADDLELRAKLRVTGEGQGELKHIKEGLDETSHAAEQAKEHMGFLEHAMSNFAAIELGEIINKTREFASELLHAADEGAAADQAVAALISTAQGREWTDAHREAEALGDELDEVAIKAHQAGPAVAEAFQTMLEITGATEQGVERASDQVGQLAQIANMLGKDVGSITKEFSMMEEGVIRTKGQLFHILGASGIFGDNTKKAAAGWAALTEEERFKRLSYALEQMSSKAAEAEPTFAQLRQSASSIVEVMSEKLGEPLLKAIAPEFKNFVEELRAGLPAIEEFGKEMSVDVQHWVHEAAEAIQSGFEYIKNHGKEIHDDIVGAVEVAKNVFQFIIDHKEAIALAFGAKAAVGIAGGIGKGAMEGPLGKGVELFVKGAEKIYAMGAGTGAAGAAAQAIPGVSNVIAGGGMLGGGLALGATAAAAGGLLAAGYQLSKLFEETSNDTRQTFDAVREGMQGMAAENTQWTDVEVDAFQRMRANLLESAQYLGEDVAAAAAFADALEKTHAAHARNMLMAEDLATAARSFEVITLSNQMDVDRAKTGAEQAAALSEQQGFQQGKGAEIVEGFAHGFEALMAAHDVGAQQYVAHLLGSSKNLFASFLQSAHMSDEGFLALATALEQGGAEFKEQARAVRDLIGSKEHQKMNVHFNMPGAKINIQQDFRDQDPDNVAIVLQRDLVRASVNELGSKFSTAFGT